MEFQANSQAKHCEIVSLMEQCLAAHDHTNNGRRPRFRSIPCPSVQQPPLLQASCGIVKVLADAARLRELSRKNRG